MIASSNWKDRPVPSSTALKINPGVIATIASLEGVLNLRPALENPEITRIIELYMKYLSILKAKVRKPQKEKEKATKYFFEKDIQSSKTL